MHDQSCCSKYCVLRVSTIVLYFLDAGWKTCNKELSLSGPHILVLLLHVQHPSKDSLKLDVLVCCAVWDWISSSYEYAFQEDSAMLLAQLCLQCIPGHNAGSALCICWCTVCPPVRDGGVCTGEALCTKLPSNK